MSERIIMVGNGQGAIGRGLGDVVDSYPRVFRFNNYVTKGFEKDLGSRTTDHVVTRGHWHGMNARREERIRFGTTTPEEEPLIWVAANHRDRAAKRMPRGIPTDRVNPLDLVVELIQELGFSDREKSSFHPTSGLAYIRWFMEMGYDVTILNFDFANTGHYFRPQDRMSQRHDMAAEGRLADRWVREGLVSRL